MNSFSLAQYQQLVLASNITSGMSLLAGCWLFLVFAKRRDLCTHSGKMILCLNISYFLYNTANLLVNFDEGQNNLICKIDGFFRTFAVLSAFYWAWKISQIAYFSISDPEFRSLEQMSLLNVIKGFMVPALIAAIPLIGFTICSYELRDFQCGITSYNANLALAITFLVDIMPPVLCLASMAYFSSKIIKIANESGIGGISPMRLLVYAFSLCAIWIPSLLFISISYITHEYCFLLDMVRISLTHSLGLAHVLIYKVQTARLSKIRRQSQHEQTIEKSKSHKTDSENSFQLVQTIISVDQLFS